MEDAMVRRGRSLALQRVPVGLQGGTVMHPSVWLGFGASERARTAFPSVPKRAEALDYVTHVAGESRPACQTHPFETEHTNKGKRDE